MTAIIDYDAGNIRSVEKALLFLSDKVSITRDRTEILAADHVILPGVGQFGDAMDKLDAYGLSETIHDVVKNGIPFLGICLGLQLLFDSSDESPSRKGLSILDGTIKKIPDGQYRKIPHMGWNSLKLSGNGRLFEGIDGEPYVYFVHSYYLEAGDSNIVKATAEYNTLIHASVEKDNVFACQFHPEKSSDVGLKMLENFLKVR